MAKSFPCHPTPRAVSLLKSLVLSMALPALQSSLKRKTGAWDPNGGISTHHFSSALNATLSAIHQPLTDLFTAQSGLCLAAQYTSKCSFDTPPPPSSSPQSLSGFNQLMESAELFGHFMAGVALLKGWASSDESTTPCQADGTHSNSKTKTYNSRLWLDVSVSLYKKKKGESKKFPSSSSWGFPLGIGWSPAGKQRTETKGKALLLHNLRPKRDKLWEVCKQQGKADG